MILTHIVMMQFLPGATATEAEPQVAWYKIKPMLSTATSMMDNT